MQKKGGGTLIKMAKQEVSGKTEDELNSLRLDFEKSPLADEKTFSEAFCLAKIRWQPSGYEGPDRYCVSNDLYKWNLCELHGGKGCGNPENLEPLAAMKHGMYATQEHLISDFDEKDKALYNWVIEEYPMVYGISKDDVSSNQNIRSLAIGMVRLERGRGYLIREGEIHEKTVRDSEGRIVTDEKGEVVTEKSEHYLAQMVARQQKLIMKIEDHLGISRHQRIKQKTVEYATESVNLLTELGSDILRQDSEYNPSGFDS